MKVAPSGRGQGRNKWWVMPRVRRCGGGPPGQRAAWNLTQDAAHPWLCGAPIGRPPCGQKPASYGPTSGSRTPSEPSRQPLGSLSRILGPTASRFVAAGRRNLRGWAKVLLERTHIRSCEQFLLGIETYEKSPHTLLVRRTVRQKGAKMGLLESSLTHGLTLDPPHFIIYAKLHRHKCSAAAAIQVGRAME